MKRAIHLNEDLCKIKASLFSYIKAWLDDSAFFLSVNYKS